jgi:hypothetical protein
MPTRIRDFAEMTVQQVERAFDAFVVAANISASIMPEPASEISKRALSITEQNMRTAVNHARGLVHAKDVHEAMRLQTEFFQTQLATIIRLLGDGGSLVAKNAAATES